MVFTLMISLGVIVTVTALLYLSVGPWIDGTVDGEARDVWRDLGKDNYENGYSTKLSAMVYDIAYRHGEKKKDRVARNRKMFRPEEGPDDR